MWHTPYSIYRRAAGDTKSKLFYVQFWDDEKKVYLPGKSLKQLAIQMGLNSEEWDLSTRLGARAVAEEALKRGLSGSSPGADQKLGDYATRFWDWDTSDYIRGRLARKSDAVGKTYCRNNKSWVVRFLVPALGHLKLSQVTTGKLETWFMGLKETSGLRVQTLNNILQAVTIPLKEAHRLGYIPRNPGATVRPLGGPSQEKGILDTKEIQALLALEWPDTRGRLAFTAALMGGLRLGEIQALRMADLGDDHVIVRHSWGKIEGLKAPKGKRSRMVPFPESFIQELKTLGKRSPWKTGFIFWDDKQGDRPWPVRQIEHAYYAALEAVGIPDAPGKKCTPGNRQARSLYFHGLRHLCNSLLRGVLPDDKLRAVIGHADISMTRHYDHLTDVDRNLVLKAQAERFLSLFPQK